MSTVAGRRSTPALCGTICMPLPLSAAWSQRLKQSSSVMASWLTPGRRGAWAGGPSPGSPTQCARRTPPARPRSPPPSAPTRPTQPGRWRPESPQSISVSRIYSCFVLVDNLVGQSRNARIAGGFDGEKRREENARQPVSRVLSAPCGTGRPFLWDAPRDAPHATNPGGGTGTSPQLSRDLKP